MKFSEKFEKTGHPNIAGHLVSALLVAEWDEWDKRPAGSLRSIQFIQLNEACRGDVKHGILWKFAFFPTFVEKWVEQ